MASIPITIPDVDFTKIVNHVAYALSYPSTVVSGGVSVANPESKENFIRRNLAEYLKSLAKKGAREEAEISAGNAAESTITPINIS